MSRLNRSQLLKSGAALALATLLPQPAPAAKPTPKKLASVAGPTPKIYDLRPFAEWIIKDFEPTVKLGPIPGQYARKPGEGLELYGVADMASIYYTLNRPMPEDAERAQWANAFQQFQRPADGWLVERSPTHNPLHNTAYALASMQLLDLKPKNPVILPDTDPATFLATIDWAKDVYLGSHRGAGFASIHYLVPELNKPQWFSAFFKVCDSLFDPHNGLMGKNKPVHGDFDQVGGTFHYGFLYETFHRAMPYPEARIDAIIGLQDAQGYWNADNHLWLTLDAIYMMTRTLRYTTHRFEDVKHTVRRTLDALMTDVYSPEGRVKGLGGTLPTHSVMAAISIVAECQRFLGSEEIVTERPLRLVLDRRPFI